MLPPLQHFVPPAAVWRRRVSPGACRNKHLWLAHNSKRKELFHYGLVCKRKLLTARKLPCRNGVRNGRGEESKGSYIPLRKHYYGSSQAVSTAELGAANSPPAHRASASQHGRLPSDARDTSGSWGARPERVVTRECKLSLTFSLFLPCHYLQPPVGHQSVRGLLKCEVTKKKDVFPYK